MRTAITTAITHEDKEVILAGRKTPVHVQFAKWKQLKAFDREHKEYAQATYQESDGVLQILNFTKPTVNKSK